MLTVLLFFFLTSQSSVDDYLNGWWIISADRSFATFGLRQSLSGPPAARRMAGRTIGSQTEAGILQTTYSIQIDCNRRTIRYLSMEALGTGGRSLGAIEPASREERAIIPASNGDYFARFACEPERTGRPSIGYPVMLPTEVVADQSFRFIGLGLAPDAAAALAAADARRAPNAFNDLLNVLVPAERQPYVRAIKTPEAPAN